MSSKSFTSNPLMTTPEHKEEKRTADSVIEWFKEAIASKVPVPNEQWMDAALLLNVLRLDEAAKLNEMRRKLAEKKVEILDGMEKRNVSEADLRVEATKKYQEMKDQQSKYDVIEEFILLAKKNYDSGRF